MTKMDKNGQKTAVPGPSFLQLVLLLGRLICPVAVTPICHSDLLAQLHDLGLYVLYEEYNTIVYIT